MDTQKTSLSDFFVSTKKILSRHCLFVLQLFVIAYSVMSRQYSMPFFLELCRDIKCFVVTFI